MGEQDGGGKLQGLALILQNAKEISVILGICAGLFGLYTAIENERRNSQASRMKDVDAVIKFIDEDSAVRKNIPVFLAKYGGGTNEGNLWELVGQKGSADAAYNSEELKEMAAIGRHYDRMGMLVKLGYLDFDLVYEVVTFPDDFWKATAEFRSLVRKDSGPDQKSWSKDGKGLPDFWANFEWLQQRYAEQREKDKKVSAERR